MGTDELIHINVIVADRPYRLKIRPEEEEGVRKAAKELNEKVRDFQNTYEAKDKQDYLAMCALMYAVESVNNQDKITIEDPGFKRKLKELDELLSETLSDSTS